MTNQQKRVAKKVLWTVGKLALRIALMVVIGDLFPGDPDIGDVDVGEPDPGPV